jgi:hypothetical protein
VKRRLNVLVALLVGGVIGVVFIDVVWQDDDPGDMRLPAIQLTSRDVVDAAYTRMLDALAETDEDAVLAGATPGQRKLFVLEYTNDEILNGGVFQMLWNLRPSLISDAVDAARLIGANAYAQVLDDALDRFPGEDIPEDDRQRHHALGAFGPSSPAWKAITPVDREFHEGMFATELRRYVETHPSDFFKRT